METLEGMFDLEFALVRRKIRLRLSYIGVGKWTYEEVQLGEKENPKMAIHALWYQYQNTTVGFCLEWYRYQ